MFGDSRVTVGGNFERCPAPVECLPGCLQLVSEIKSERERPRTEPVGGPRASSSILDFVIPTSFFRSSERRYRRRRRQRRPGSPSSFFTATAAAEIQHANRRSAAAAAATVAAAAAPTPPPLSFIPPPPPMMRQSPRRRSAPICTAVFVHSERSLRTLNLLPLIIRRRRLRKRRLWIGPDLPSSNCTQPWRPPLPGINYARACAFPSLPSESSLVSLSRRVLPAAKPAGQWTIHLGWRRRKSWR